VADPRTLVVGEALVDVVHRAGGAVDEHVGGSPANVAAGLAALGHDVVLATHLGDDDRGRRVAAYLQERGVLLAEGSSSAARTSSATARLDSSGAADYEFDITWDLPAVSLDGVDHLHTGSLAATTEPGASRVLELVAAARERTTVSYDPNLRPGIMGDPHGVRSRVEELIGRCDVVKASAEDVQGLYGAAPLAEVAHLWGRLGPTLVLVTRGGDGVLVHLSGPDTEHALSAAPAEVVDTVGAGDSFMSGLLSGLLDAGLLGRPGARAGLWSAGPEDVRQALERALACARHTVQQAGAATPTRDVLPG